MRAVRARTVEWTDDLMLRPSIAGMHDVTTVHHGLRVAS